MSVAKVYFGALAAFVVLIGFWAAVDAWQDYMGHPDCRGTQALYCPADPKAFCGCQDMIRAFSDRKKGIYNYDEHLARYLERRRLKARQGDEG